MIDGRIALVPANIRDWVNDAKHEVDVALARAEKAEAKLSECDALKERWREADTGSIGDEAALVRGWCADELAAILHPVKKEQGGDHDSA